MVSEVKKMKILIVDDDRGICDTLNDIMTEYGFNVVVAYDGFQAIEKINENGFDAALIDVRMPGINGVETYKHIKQNHPDFTAFLMTAFATNGQISAALQEGVLGIIDKPFDVSKVCKMLTDLGR